MPLPVGLWRHSFLCFGHSGTFASLISFEEPQVTLQRYCSIVNRGKASVFILNCMCLLEIDTYRWFILFCGQMLFWLCAWCADVKFHGMLIGLISYNAWLMRWSDYLLNLASCKSLFFLWLHVLPWLAEAFKVYSFACWSIRVLFYPVLWTKWTENIFC